MNQTAWLLEGLAVSNGMQKAFVTPPNSRVAHWGSIWRA
jgi:hypothetical protein